MKQPLVPNFDATRKEIDWDAAAAAVTIEEGPSSTYTYRDGRYDVEFQVTHRRRTEIMSELDTLFWASIAAQSAP